MSDKVSIGILDLEGIPFDLTLEPPWKDNRINESCSPKGEYPCKRIISEKFGETFEIIVPNRTAMLFHKGNYVTETHGCILLGTAIGETNDLFSIENSGVAFSRFMRLLKGENEFKLVITEV